MPEESKEILIHTPSSSSSPKRGSHRNTFWSYVSYLLMYVIMVCSVSFNGIMYAKIKTFRSALHSLQTAGLKYHKVATHPVVTEPQVCVPCDLFANNSFAKKLELQNFPMEDRNDCCKNASNGDVVRELITQGVERQLEKEKKRGEFGAVKHVITHQKEGGKFTTWKNKPVAHLLGCVREQKHFGDPYEPQEIRRWLIPGDHRKTVLKNGLKYRDGRIIISTEGLYYVYSQVLFIEGYTVSLEEQPEQAKFKDRRHYIHRYNINHANNGEDELLRGIATKCWSKYKEVGEHTSYLGGVFHLKPGDELFVKVSKISEVSRLALSNNFGVYML